MNVNELSFKVIGAAMEVHRELGPGLLESTYEECLCYELSKANLPFQRQLELPIHYKSIKLDCGYRMDIVVDKRLVLELKSVEVTLPLHEAQLITYLKLSQIDNGLLINFNVPFLKEGIHRKFRNPT